MLKYCDGTELKKYFGDFGGNIDMSDFETAMLSPDVAGIRALIESDEFARAFREILPLVCGGFEVRSFDLPGGRTLRVVPALAKRYILAARLAYAKCRGKAGVAIGSDDADTIRLACDAAQKLGFPVKATLSRALSLEGSLAAELRARGVEVDDVSCVELTDMAYGHAEPHDADPEFCVLELEANYGAWPIPALTGVFAGLYGADVLDRLGAAPEACVVPITTGTEALAMIKGFSGTGCRLATCEPTVAQELHTIDYFAYTLATRSADEEKPETSICPELADLWRKNKVLRMGCDRILAVDVSALEAAGLSGPAKRAAALALEAMDCKDLLVVEV